MVKVRESLAGMTFGRLTVLEQAEDIVTTNGARRSQWLCQCSCEHKTYVVVDGSKLKNGHTQSCGCLQKERTSVTHKKFNKYSEKLIDDHGEYYIGWTINTNRQFYVDADNFSDVEKYCWYEHINVLSKYCALETKDPDTGKNIRMHQLVAGKNYDHKDRNPFNNRKYNLRQATFSENVQNRKKPKNNTSCVIGVSWDKSRNKWYAGINVNKKHVSLGRFESKTDAIVARLQAEQKYFGEFAPQSNLFEKYKII